MFQRLLNNIKKFSNLLFIIFIKFVILKMKEKY